MRNYFKPEFLNRFDGIIQFNPLQKEHLLIIVDLMLKELNDQLKENNKTLTVTDEVKEKLVELGYNPDFGARPLRRTIQEKLGDKIADFILDHPEVTELRAELKENEIVIASQS